MPDEENDRPWIVAKIVALWEKYWEGEPGERFRNGVSEYVEYDNQNLHSMDRIRALPKTGLATLEYYSSQALERTANTELKNIEIAKAKETADDEIHTSHANRLKAESEARQSQTQESILETQLIDGRLTLALRFKEQNSIPIWDQSGKMLIVPAPANYDWNALISSLMQNRTLVAPHALERPKNVGPESEDH